MLLKAFGKMLCVWCRVDYEGSPLYHVCSDGITFDIRREKTEEEIQNEYDRQDRIKLAYRTRRDRESFEEKVVMNWSSYDIEFLKGCRIRR